MQRPREVLGTGAAEWHGHSLTLQPYGLAWFIDDADTILQPGRP